MKKKKAYFYRGVFYALGLLLLAIGITLNTKTGLGVSPIISVPYSISQIWDLNFGNMTLIIYVIFIFIEMVLHTMRSQKEKRQGNNAITHARQIDLKLTILMDLLQLPLSLIFTRFLNVFSAVLPDLKTTYPGQFVGSFAGRFLFLLVAIILTGAGAAMSLNMRLIPNPGDGIVQAIADTIHKSVGFSKNCFDVLNISITITLSLVCRGTLIGIGVGTVAAVICVGRVIAVYNHFYKEKQEILAGMKEESLDTI